MLNGFFNNVIIKNFIKYFIENYVDLGIKDVIYTGLWGMTISIFHDPLNKNM